MGIRTVRLWQAELHFSFKACTPLLYCCSCTVIRPDVEALKPNIFSPPSPPLFSDSEATFNTQENYCLPFMNTGSLIASDFCTHNIWVNIIKFSVTSLGLFSSSGLLLFTLTSLITETAPLTFPPTSVLKEKRTFPCTFQRVLACCADVWRNKGSYKGVGPNSGFKTLFGGLLLY